MEECIKIQKNKLCQVITDYKSPRQLSKTFVDNSFHTTVQRRIANLIQRLEPPLTHAEEVHLGGETNANGLSGGHLLSEMQTRWAGNLNINLANQIAARPWNTIWSINGNVATPKVSTMFPTKFTINLINERLKKATRLSKNQDRILFSGFNVYRRAGTIYPI